MSNYPTAQAYLDTFLQMNRSAARENGYRALFCGPGQPAQFSNGYVDHPRTARRFVDCTGRRFWAAASGAYRLMAVSPIPDGSGQSTSVDTWDRIKQKLSLPDFSTASQDRAAVELIFEAGALDDVRAGRFAAAIDKLTHIWPSLAGTDHGTPAKPLGVLRTAYLETRGQVP